MENDKPDPRQAITILLADDEPIVLSSLKLILERDDRRVLAAGNGEEALNLAEEHSGDIHLLISDLRMPGMNGIALANQLCARIPGLPVLLMSGYLGEFNLSEAPKHSVVLEKPFTANQLNNLVDRLIERAQNTRGS